jgi:hypothetical protein
MAAGGALISSPILIHLINRMRFKRIRWAAMEFLLKSQKRNRRRLIIEQMILLLLRILLVLLAAFLVARFLFAGTGTKGATHVVVVDDTLSMADRNREGGRSTTAYATAIAQVKELARNAAQAPSAQFMRVYLLSELDRAPLFDGRLSDRSVDQIDEAFLKRRTASFRHVSPLQALVKGHAFLAESHGEVSQRVLHFVSDFRDRDWTTGVDAEKIQEEIKKILENRINLNLVDVAHPTRSSGSTKVALHHDNLALVDLKAESRVAIEDTDIEFTAVIRNFGTGEGRGRFQVFINGQEDLGRAQPLDRLPAGRDYEHKFTLRFPRKVRPGLEITEKDRPEERERKRRLQRQFFHIRVEIGREDVGLNADNIRDLIIEVRSKIPTLVVDGNKPEGRGDTGDMAHLQAFYAASAIYEIEERRIQDLETADLDLYPSIVLLNVPEIESPRIRDRLKKYVEAGGSLCWFLGEEVKPEHYNTDLFQAGLFPVKIGDRPFDPLAAAYPDPEVRRKERDRLRTQDPQPKILFRKPEHPLVSRLAPFRSVFRYLGVNVYWQAQPRGQWDPEPRKAEELIVLPNTGGLDKYRNEAMRLAGEAARATADLAKREPEYKRFVGPVENYRIRIRNALVSSDLFKLAEALEGLLLDAGVKDDPEKPKMPDLWGHVSMGQLASQLREFRELVLFGDPLVVSKRQGKGRLVVMLTTAGTSPRRGVSGEDQVQWNNWGAGEKLVSQTYPLFLLDMQRYLVSEGQAPNRVVGESIELTFDAQRYDRNVTWTFLPQPDLEDQARKVEEEKDKGAMDKDKNVLTFRLKDPPRPGVYRFTFTLTGDGAEEDRREVRAYAYNVDASQESDLKRAARDRLEPNIPGDVSQRGALTVRLPGEGTYDQFKERQPDASESPWLYLFFIIILVVEQAMAVHLSFHLKGAEGAAPAATRQPAAAA